MRVAADGSELAEGRLRERGRVEPLLDARIEPGRVRIPDQVGAVGPERIEHAAEILRRHRDREAALPGVDAVHLPAADDARS